MSDEHLDLAKRLRRASGCAVTTKSASHICTNPFHPPSHPDDDKICVIVEGFNGSDLFTAALVIEELSKENAQTAKWQARCLAAEAYIAELEQINLNKGDVKANLAKVTWLRIKE